MTADRGSGLLVPAARVLAVLLLVGGLVLTLARLWQPGSGPFEEPMIRLVALVPVAVPLYALAALAGVLVVRRSRRLGAPVLLLAVLGLALHLWWFSPYLADDAAPAEGPHLRVLTLNALAYQGASGEELVQVARDSGADVVVAEEVTGDAYADAQQAGLASAFPHLSFEPEAGDTATMIWSRLPVTDLRTVPGASGILRATLRWHGRDLDLLGVHTGPPIWPRTWRVDHAALLRDVRSTRPDLLAGDFNATPDHVQLRRLLDEGLHDAADLAGTGWAPTWPSNGRQHLLGIPVPRFAAIDHVLVSDDWTVVSLRRVDIPRSDHTGLLAEVARSAR